MFDQTILKKLNYEQKRKKKRIFYRNLFFFNGQGNNYKTLIKQEYSFRLFF